MTSEKSQHERVTAAQVQPSTGNTEAGAPSSRFHGSAKLVEILDVHLAEKFWITLKPGARAAPGFYVVPREQAEALGVELPPRKQADESVVCLPAPRTLAALYRWLKPLIDGVAATLPPLTLRFDWEAESQEDLCTVKVTEMASRPTVAPIMRAKLQGVYNLFIQGAYMEGKGLPFQAMRWDIGPRTRRIMCERDGMEVSLRPSVLATIDITKAVASCTLAAVHPNTEDPLPGLEPLKGTLSNPLRTIGPVFGAFIDFLLCGGEVWQPDPVIDSSDGTTSGTKRVLVDFETASLSDLRSEFVRTMPPMAVRRLEALLREAQCSDPPDKPAFVRDINELLDVLSLRIKTDEGEAGRLWLNPNGSLQITKSGGRGSGAFRTANISLTPVPRHRGGNRYTPGKPNPSP